MATVNKDFKIKHGLIVEGTTGTINGEDILTKAQVDIDYIIDQVGGSGTSANTPDTLVLRDGSGNFAAGTITVNQINIGEIGNIHDDGDIVISNTNGQDVILEGEDIRLNAQDDVRLNAQGDVVLDATTGNIRFQGPNIFAGENISYTDAERVATRGYVDDAASSAQTNANSYTNGELENYTPTNSLDATVGGYGYIKSADLPTMYSDADVDAHLYGGQGIDYYQGQISVNIGTGINFEYSGVAIDRNTVDTWYDASGSAATAEQNAKDYADDKVADLVNGAPALLDTLNELAAALQDNPDVITDLQDIAAGKQDTLTPGNGIDIDGSSNISVDPLDLVGANHNDYVDLDIKNGKIALNKGTLTTYTNTLYDATGSAAAAQTAAETFATNAINALDTDDIEEGSNLYFTNQRAIDAVTGTIDNAINALDTDDIEEGLNNLYYTDSRAQNAAALLLTNATLENITITGGGTSPLVITAENGVADSTTDDLEEGNNNLYFTDQRAIDALQETTPNFTAVELDSIAKQVAATVSAPTAASQITAYSWAKADYRSAKFLVKTAYGTHTELTEVLITLDSSDNVAIVEYATVGTNGSSMAVTADVDGSNVRLRVTPVNNNSTVTVMGTLLA